MNEEKFDRLLREAVLEDYNNESIELPDRDIVWHQIEKRLEEEYRRKRMHQMRRRWSLLVASSLLLFIVFSMPQASTAFTKVYEITQAWREGIVRIIIQPFEQKNEGQALTSLPTDNDLGWHGAFQEVDKTSPREIASEDIEHTLTFKALYPQLSEVDSYNLEKIVIWPSISNQKSDSIRFDYVGENTWFSITQEKLYEQSINTTEALNTKEIEEVMIGGDVGILISSKNGIHSLDWVYNDEIKISIYGKLGREEIIKIARSMQ